MMIFLSGCKVSEIGFIHQDKILTGSPVVTAVSVSNNQFIINGSNLQDVTQAKLQGSSNHTFDIESKSQNQIVLNARSALSLLVSGTFDFLISNASGAATFPVTFTLNDGQVTAAKLSNMSATAGQVLRFDGTNWGPASISSSQIYSGTYNATTDTPDIVSVGGPAGTFYIVSTAGTQNLGTGPITFAVGDWVIFDGSSWSKVPLSGNTVTSFNGRTGVVTPLADDYTWSMLQKTSGKLTGSKLEDIADVDVSGLSDGHVLKWLTNKWTASPETYPTAQSSSLPVSGGSVLSFTQSATDSATSSRAVLTLQNNGTGGANEYNLVSQNASGTPTFSVTQSGFGSFSSGVRVGVSTTTPLIYGSSVASGNLTLESTSDTTKGNVLIAPGGGQVGVGISSPVTLLDVHVSDPTLYVSSSTSLKTPVTASSAAIQISNPSPTQGSASYLQFRTQNTTTSSQTYIGAVSTVGFGSDLTIGMRTGSTRYNERLRILGNSGNVGIGTTGPTAKLEVVGEIKSTDGSGNTRLWGQGRANIARFGTTGSGTGLCTNGSVSFGLSNVAVTWDGAHSACPSGTWVCTGAERGTAACDTARFDSTSDAVSATASSQDFPANAHIGWLSDATAGATNELFGATVSEQGTSSSDWTRSMRPVWCCN